MITWPDLRARVRPSPEWPFGYLVRRDHVLVAGAPGCGKTPFAAELAGAAGRAVYFDPTGEWAEHGEVIPAAELRDTDRAAELLAGRFLRLVVVPDDAELAEDFEATVAACRAAAGEGGLVLLVDEAGDLARTSTETLIGLHRNGHKDGIASILASPSWTDFPKRCRDTASLAFSFFQKNADDRRTMAAEYGDDFATHAAAWRHPQPPAAWESPARHDG